MRKLIGAAVVLASIGIFFAANRAVAEEYQLRDFQVSQGQFDTVPNLIGSDPSHGKDCKVAMGGNGLKTYNCGSKRSKQMPAKNKSTQEAYIETFPQMPAKKKSTQKAPSNKK